MRDHQPGRQGAENNWHIKNVPKSSLKKIRLKFDAFSQQTDLLELFAQCSATLATS